MSRASPQWLSVKLDKLRPTQITVGRHEVAQKRREWAKLGHKARAEAIANHWFPGVIGPGGKHYIVDHHHFGLALIEEDIRRVSLMVLKDLSWLRPDHFWFVMDHHQWVHPYDSNGQRRGFGAVPRNLTDLQDDPYRSLAGELRRAGGFAKDVTPFSEFLWADYLRRRIRPALVRTHFANALKRATELARSDNARYLPGWTGVIQTP